MRSFILSMLIFSNAAQAQFIKELCQSRARHISYVQDYVTDGHSIWTKMGEVVSFQPERFHSLATSEDRLWLLQQESLIETNQHGIEMARYELPQLSVMGWGKRVITHGSMIYIVRGSGVTAFDDSSKSFLWSHQLDDLTSTTAVDGAHDGNNLHLLMAGIREDGFHGIVTINPAGERVKALSLNISRSGIFAEQARMHWHQDKLVINNSGWMKIVSAEQLAANKSLVLKPIATSISLGENLRKQVAMSGDFFISENTLQGCGSYSELVNGNGRTTHDLFSFDLP